MHPSFRKHPCCPPILPCPRKLTVAQPSEDHQHYEDRGNQQVSFHVDEWEQLFDKASEARLVFKIQIAGKPLKTDTIWREMDQQLQEGFGDRHLLLPPSTSQSNEQSFPKLDWMMMRPALKGSQTWVIKRDTKLTGAQFTLANVLKAAKLKNPVEGQGNVPVLVIGASFKKFMFVSELNVLKHYSAEAWACTGSHLHLP